MTKSFWTESRWTKEPPLLPKPLFSSFPVACFLPSTRSNPLLPVPRHLPNERNVSVGAKFQLAMQDLLLYLALLRLVPWQISWRRLSPVAPRTPKQHLQYYPIPGSSHMPIQFCLFLCRCVVARMRNGIGEPRSVFSRGCLCLLLTHFFEKGMNPLSLALYQSSP